MKRLAILFTTLVFSIPNIGCGDGTSTTSMANEDQSTWGEARKSKAKMQADELARVANANAKANAKAAKKSR